MTEQVDIAIIGAGPVGMTLALALAGSRHRVMLIDRQTRGHGANDPRAVALSYGSRQTLLSLKAWNEPAATPIHDIHVSQRGGFGRTLIRATDLNLPALGYVVRYGDLSSTLNAQIPGTQILDQCTVGRIATNAACASIELSRNERPMHIDAKLVVHAEGSPADSETIPIHHYGQHAIIAEVRPATSHAHRAWERFTPGGPLALLPLGDAYALVLTVPTTHAARLLALNDIDFLGTLEKQFGRDMRFVATTPRTGYPLKLHLRKRLVDNRAVWIGNTAQTLHPVSGQGLNLGLRDACELAQLLSGLNDPGDTAVLAAYASRRSLDRKAVATFTDSIVRLFSNNLPPLRWARGLGLLSLDLNPAMRDFVARRMIWGARSWV